MVLSSSEETLLSGLKGTQKDEEEEEDEEDDDEYDEDDNNSKETETVGSNFYSSKESNREFPPASTTIQIPVSHLKDKINLTSETQKIACKTSTHIDSYDLPQFGKVRFNIFGKWRDTFKAGRLLWYSLTKHYTVYVHSNWWPDLDKTLPDQNGKPLRKLYRGVAFRLMEEFNLIAISGPCWDVLKVRKELFRRRVSNEEVDMVAFENNRQETVALQVLKSIKTDIHEDPVRPSDSLYYLKNAQLLQLLTGPKVTEKQLEKRIEKPPSLTSVSFKERCDPSAPPLISTLESELNKLEIIEVPISPAKSSRLFFQDPDPRASKEVAKETFRIREQIETKFLEEVYETCLDDPQTESEHVEFPKATDENSELKKHVKIVLELLSEKFTAALDEESKLLLYDLEQQINHIKLCSTAAHLSSPLKKLLAQNIITDLCGKTAPRRYSKMRAVNRGKVNDDDFQNETSLISKISSATSMTTNDFYTDESESPINTVFKNSSSQLTPVYDLHYYNDNQPIRSIAGDSYSKSFSLEEKTTSPTICSTLQIDTFSPPSFFPYKNINTLEVEDSVEINDHYYNDDTREEKIVERLRQLLCQAGGTSTKFGNETNSNIKEEPSPKPILSRPNAAKKTSFRTRNSQINNLMSVSSLSYMYSTCSLTQLPPNLTTLVSGLKRPKYDKNT